MILKQKLFRIKLRLLIQIKMRLTRRRQQMQIISQVVMRHMNKNQSLPQSLLVKPLIMRLLLI